MGFSHGYGALPPKEDAIRLIRMAYELGCTHFDTAEGYGAGANEELVGEALAPIRRKVTIATKLHIYSGENLEQQMESRLDASLKRLGTDYVEPVLPAPQRSRRPAGGSGRDHGKARPKGENPRLGTVHDYSGRNVSSFTGTVLTRTLQSYEILNK